jgi:DNA helicase-2/ATP-dependent DNA helicase PcrA
MEWSDKQQTIFKFIETNNKSLIIEAVAGSGKTATIVEGYNRVKGSAIFLAFNKAIATELKNRGLNARTFHSLCFSPVTRAKANSDIDTNKTRRLVHSNLSGIQEETYGTFIARLVSLAKQAGIGCVIPDTDEAWNELIDHHELDLDNENGDLPTGIELARKILLLSCHVRELDYDDLLYLAVKDGLPLPKFDVVFVDEAQDTNAIQRAILRKIIKPGGRLIAVGDPAQAIYGFRGADSDSLNLIAEEFKCERLPLSISYRCSQKVVKFAQHWVKMIESSPLAKEGTVSNLGGDWSPKDFHAGELVVCRTTAPLIELAYRMLSLRLPVQVLGKEIGKGLINLINKMNAKGIDKLEEKLAQYVERECEKFIAKMQEGRAEALKDKVAAIFCLIHGLKETNRTIPALIEVIDHLFADDANAVKLSTIHKAKGLEADCVYWLNSSQCPCKWATQGWQIQQELNLCYVAATRAKSDLILIESK